jgi:hypothetical protein
MAVLILLNILGGFFTYSRCSAGDGKVFPKYSVPISIGVWHFTPHLNYLKRPANDGKQGSSDRLLYCHGSLKSAVAKDFSRLTLHCPAPGQPFPRVRSRRTLTNGRDLVNDVLYTQTNCCAKTCNNIANMKRVNASGVHVKGCPLGFTRRRTAGCRVIFTGTNKFWGWYFGGIRK